MAFKGMPKRHEITYDTLAEGDRILDRNENEWLALGVERDGEAVDFWLAEPVGKVRKHRMSKPASDPVTVLRQPSRAESITDAEEHLDAEVGKPSKEATEAEAVAAVVEGLDAVPVAEETADHEAARDIARASGEPMSLPPFEEFTDPEMRSHLFLVHGVYAHDVKTRKALVKMHADLHADEKGQHTPHNHEGEFAA